MGHLFNVINHHINSILLHYLCICLQRTPGLAVTYSVLSGSSNNGQETFQSASFKLQKSQSVEQADSNNVSKLLADFLKLTL